MTNIAGIPYTEARFDKDGRPLGDPAAVPNGTTDLVIISHGWNNNEEDARGLYMRLFENFVSVAQPNDLPGRTFAIVGVIWPSKKFDELVAVSEAANAGGSAGLGSSDNQSFQALEQKLQVMKTFFTEPDQLSIIEEARALLPGLEDKASARRAFVEKIRSLLDPRAANAEDASDSFFKDDGNDLMKSLKVNEDDLDEELSGSRGGSVSLPLNAVPVEPRNAVGAAGLTSFLSGFKAAAMNILNFTTYFEMKARAGMVGKNGVAPLIDRLGSTVRAIHLIGHSFGGRVVTAAAAASSTDKLKSLSLLQAAFSHNGFSLSEKGFFRSVVKDHRVNGPILITHTKNDKAVGMAYPLASRINGDKSAAFGDENDVFGGIGRNGAQKMESEETIRGKLLPVGSIYAFQPGKFFNLEASDFIPDHGRVTGKEVAHALRKAFAS